MIFEILAQKKGAGEATFYYDNEFNILKDADGKVFEYPADKRIKRDVLIVIFIILMKNLQLK